MVSDTFFSQGVANLTVPLVAMVSIHIFGDPGFGNSRHITTNMGWSWRWTLALGAVPGILLLPFKVFPML